MTCILIKRIIRFDSANTMSYSVAPWRSGCPRWPHKPEIVGSNPTGATSLKEVQVRLKKKISDFNGSTSDESVSHFL